MASGSPSCAHWLSWHCGIALPTGREHLRVAAALADLPVTTRAFAAGELSFAKVRALTRIVTADTEGDLVAMAHTATAAQLEAIVRAYRRCATDDREGANARHEQRRVSLRDDDDGSLVISGRVPTEGAPLVKAALELMAEKLSDGLPAGDVPTAAQLLADALVACCEAVLAHGVVARPGTERTMVNVLVNAETITGDDPDGVCQISEGGAIARATVRRFLCDCATMPVIEAVDGKPVALGRTQRTCNRRQRRALLARHRGCLFPSCQHDRFIDVHHVVHWTDGGPTLLPNLLPLCWFHHRLVHEGGFTIEMVEGRHVFRNPEGKIVEEPPIHRATADLRDTYGVPGDTIRARGNGESFDLGLTIDALFGLDLDASAETPIDVMCRAATV
jgi:hypothetical protein